MTKLRTQPFVFVLVAMMSRIALFVWIKWKRSASILRFSWIPLASLAISVALFAVTPQAPDLFLHSGAHAAESIFYWIAFYAFLVCIWLIPLFVCARASLVYGREKASGELRPSVWACRRVPALITIAALLGTIVGQFRAYSGILESFVGVTLEEGYSGFQGRYHWPLTFFDLVPKIVFVCVACLGMASGFLVLRARRRAAFLSVGSIGCILLLGLASLALTLVLGDGDLGSIIRRMLSGLDYAPVCLLPFAFATAFLIPLTWAVAMRFSSASRMENWHLKLSLIASVAVITLAIVLHPIALSSIVAGAQLLPIILGVWLPPLTYLQLVGMRNRVPALAGGILAVFALSALFGDGHDLRVNPDKPYNPDARLLLEEELDRWAAVNGCEIGGSDPERRCPPPILVAVAGGASRAAFFSSGVLGELLDQTESSAEQNQRFSNRLFAVSAVSGGATGTSFFRAAQGQAIIATERNGILRSPCQDHVIQKDKWYFGASSYGGAEKIASREATEAGAIEAARIAADPTAWTQLWRTCLQALSAGDFLSASITSLVTRDALQLSAFVEDRANALERNWEKRFRDLVGSDWLAQDFLSLRSEVRAERPDRWLPLMFFQSTSVGNGRRVFFSDFQPFDCFTFTTRDFTSSFATWGSSEAREACVNVFADATDVFHLLEDVDQEARWSLSRTLNRAEPCPDCSIPLSAAASASARFPLVSPHVNIRNYNGAKVDRLVDGGYFENTPALATLEIVEAITRIARRRGDRSFAPAVIVINNDPFASLGTGCSTTGQGGYASFPPVAGADVFSVATVPVGTFVNTRNSRGRHSTAQLCRRVAEIWSEAAPNASGSQHLFDLRRLGNFYIPFDVALADQPRSGLSMSWWLSRHTQEGLDGLSRGWRYEDEIPIREVLEVLSPEMARKAVLEEEGIVD